MATRLHRRTFLRGLGGTAIALPWLEAMVESPTHAATGDAPSRYLVAFGGYSLGGDGDDSGNRYRPQTMGAGYDLPQVLTPLAEHGVAPHVSIVSGLRIGVPSGAIEPGPGQRAGGDSFHFHPNPLLCGMRQAGGTFGSIVTGPSSDQVVADAIAGDTLFHSLTLRAQALYYSVGGNFVVDNPTNRDTLSFRDEAGDVFAVPPMVSPKQTFDSLFATFVPDDPAAAAAKTRRLALRRSVLDVVDRRMGGVYDRLGVADQRRLQRHFDELRALETRLDAPPPMADGACRMPSDPGEDPPLGGVPADPYAYDINLGYSDEDARADLLIEMVAMAFACDLTRSATLMLTMFQSLMNIEPITGVAAQAHLLNHEGSSADLGLFQRWHIEKFASLVARLAELPEGDGTVLDHCALVMLNEGGYGGDPYFGDPFTSHTTEDMVALVAGGAGGLTQGRHIAAPAGADHPVNVLLTAMQAVGVDTNTLGEVSGTIPELRS
jgi:hypothetical protein